MSPSQSRWLASWKSPFSKCLTFLMCANAILEQCFLTISATLFSGLAFNEPEHKVKQLFGWSTNFRNFSMLAASFCYLLFFGNTNNITSMRESPGPMWISYQSSNNSIISVCSKQFFEFFNQQLFSLPVKFIKMINF